MTSTTRTNLGILTSITLFGAIIGATYTSVVYLSQPDPQGSIWIGVFIGMLLSGGATVFELFIINRPESKIRLLPFYALFLIRVFAHLCIIVCSIFMVQYSFSVISGTPLFLIGDNTSETVTDIIFSVAVIAIIIFWMQMRVFIGSRTLKNLILGKYYKPQLEERIFLIVDVEGSTSAAEMIGNAKFHSFLNKLFILFDPSIHKKRWRSAFLCW